MLRTSAGGTRLRSAAVGKVHLTFTVTVTLPSPLHQASCTRSAASTHCALLGAPVRLVQSWLGCSRVRAHAELSLPGELGSRGELSRAELRLARHGPREVSR